MYAHQTGTLEPLGSLYTVVRKIYCYGDPSAKKGLLASRLSKTLTVTGTDTDRSATYNFVLVIQSNHGPISYRFRDKRRFQSNCKSFPPSEHAPAEVVSLEFRNCGGALKLEWCPYKMVKNVWRRVQPFRCNTRMLQTDGNYIAFCINYQLLLSINS